MNDSTDEDRRQLIMTLCPDCETGNTCPRHTNHKEGLCQAIPTTWNKETPMNDFTDQYRRQLRKDAEAVINKTALRTSAAVSIARYVLATVDAPEPTIAERLRSRADLLDNGDPDGDTPQALRTLADLVDQMERDIIEARAEATLWKGEYEELDKSEKSFRLHLEDAEAEVKRLTREQGRLQAQVQGLVRRDGDHNSEVRMLTEERDEALAEVERLTAVQKGAERNAEILDPADVPPGEAWLIGRPGAPGIGVRNCPHTDFPWTVVEDEGHVRVMDSGIVLRSRLVPAPRENTNENKR